MADHRVIKGLKWALFFDGEWPASIPRSKPKGVRAKGIRYEKAVSAALPGADHGRWIEFEDENGHGLAQPDILFRHNGALVILECKLTWTPKGHTQISQLYAPLLRSMGATKIKELVICKNLVPDIPFPVFTDLGEALESKCESAVVHWIGAGPLFLTLPAIPIT